MTDELWGQQLKRWRTVAGLGRAKLARAGQVSERNIANLEERDQRPSAATVRALTDALTIALTDVEGGWTPDQRAIFAAGPLEPSNREGPAESPGHRAGAATDPSREQPKSLVTPSAGVAPAAAPGIDRRAPALVEDQVGTVMAIQPAGSTYPRRGSRQLSAVGVVGIVIAALFTVVVMGRQGESPVSSGQITTPAPDSRIPSPLDVRGSASIATGQELWLLIKARNNSFYTVTYQPAPIIVDAGGDWTVNTVGVGKDGTDVGKKYEFYLVASPVGGAVAAAVHEKPAERHSVEFKELPAEITVLDSVIVELSDI